MNRGGILARTSGEDDLLASLEILVQLLHDHPADRLYMGYRAQVEANLAQARLETDPESALQLGMEGLAALLPPSGPDVLEGADREADMTMIHSVAQALTNLGRLEEGFEFLEQYGDEIAGGHPWRCRLIADCWNEWCLAYAEQADARLLEVDAGLAEERLFEFLGRAVRAGYSDLRELETTPELDPFREDDRFRFILEAFGG